MGRYNFLRGAALSSAYYTEELRSSSFECVWIDKEHIGRKHVPLKHGNVECVFQREMENDTHDQQRDPETLKPNQERKYKFEN
jgi:hypothetical protein